MAFSVHAANPDGKPAIEMQAVDHNQEIPELSWYLDGFLNLPMMLPRQRNVAIR
ncbi:hypothetical protein [Aliamphritea spongicola]|nr:hypothetical protein [Aliamphritea spongicola]